MHKPLQLLLTVCAAAAVASSAFAQTPGVKLVSSGEFKDKDGAIHAWKINGAHTLIWDGQPYLPVGGVFYSKYICLGQTEDNWQADVKALEEVKSKGITDILLKSVSPASWIKPEAWQKLIEYLDSSGFTYGIDLNDGPKAPLDGYIIEPTRYRVNDITKDTVLTFDMPDVVAGIWLLCRTSDGSALTSGGASVTDGKVKIQVKAPPGETSVLLFYPVKELSNGGTDGVADLWGGFDEYRDRMLTFISAVKFGKGLRFFVDPLSSKMDFTGERASIIPDSAEYRLEFESYLAKKYQNIGSLNAVWGLKGENLTSFEQAARIIPLWRGPRGIPEVYDRARGKRAPVDAARSRIWEDIRSFRDSSAQSYLNLAADLVKRNAANVPVIYEARNYHRVFANTVSKGGFDGLGGEAYGHGESLVDDYAGPIYSLTEESARSMWFVVTGTQDTPGREKPTPGYDGKEALIADLDTLGQIGAKGIFVLGLQVLPDEKWRNHSLVHVPDQLDWLKSFKDGYQTTERAEFVPKVVYYPAEPIIGAVTKRLGQGEWWLPSLRSGSYVYFGDSIGSYVLPGQDGICIWSRSGNATATFSTTPADRPTVVFPASGNGALSIDKNKAILKLTESPIIVTGLDPLHPFPAETADAEIARLDPLVARAKAGGTRVVAAEDALTTARGLLKSGETARAYEMAHLFAGQLAQDLGTYSWVEGEQSVASSFEGFFPAFGASAGGVLRLDTAVKPPMSPYTATFTLFASKEVPHQLWLAGTAVDNGISPFSYSVDNGPWQQADLSEPVSPYGRGFAWYKFGIASLAKGGHVLRIQVDGPGNERTYKLDIDAIVASPTDFKPAGLRKP